MASSLITPATAHAEAVEIYPTPQQVTARDDGFPLSPVVGLVRTTRSDPQAEAVVRQALQAAGVKRVETTDGADPKTPVTLWLGGGSDKLGVAGPEGLPAEGYVLAAGESESGKHVALDGVDADGTYYAALTFAQLIQRRQGNDRVPGVVVRDWPSMAYRGSIEGFYGTPWSHQDRLDHLDYLGAHRMNTYQYAPKDDPYHRDRWRDPYPQDKLAQLGELIGRARANRVDFTFAISPGLSICYTSADDVNKLLAKFEAIYSLGGRSFNVALDDIDPNRWNCEGDRAKYAAKGPGWAQTDLLNTVQAWVRGKGDVAPLQTVPTEYYNATETPYKKAFRDNLDAEVIVHWTGWGVVPTVILKREAAEARAVFGHKILVWDNYPVNDYAPGRLLIAPYTGRENGLSESLVGIISNPMNQAAVSKISLYSFGEFGWNDRAYDAEQSWLRALAERADGDAATVQALRDFADLNTLDGTLHTKQSPVLAAAIAKGEGLRELAERYAKAPDLIERGVPDQAFLDEAKSWLDATRLWTKALVRSLDLLEEVRADDGAGALAIRAEITKLVADAKAIRDVRQPHSTTFPKIGDGVLDRFVTDALKVYDAWIGVGSGRATASSTLGVYSGYGPELMADGNLDTFYWSPSSPRTGDAISLDLGSVKPIGDIAVLMGKPSSPNDYIRSGVLEYSLDGQSWNRLTSGSTAEVRARAPEGTLARYVRYRSAGAQDYWLVVREFTVATLGDAETRLTASGAPAGDLAATVDGNLDTVYTAATAPAEGEALQVALSRPRLIDKVVVIGSGAAEVQVRTDGQWKGVGALTGAYTELDVTDLTGDAVRLAWTAGGAKPQIAEIVPRYADVPAAELRVTPGTLVATAGQKATATVVLSSQLARPVAETLTVSAPEGWTVSPDRKDVTVPRGGQVAVPFEITPPAGAAGRTEKLSFTFGAVTQELQAVVHRPVSADNLAKGRPATASSVEGGTVFDPAKAVDGDARTRWSSRAADGEWFQVELAEPVDVGKVVLRWEAAYGAAYRVEVSADGTTWTRAAEVSAGDGGVDEVWIDSPNSTRFVRMQGVRRATRYGYSLWEVEIHRAA
ncbi:beta-N-acetylglucosaminidase domain-containing protein [Nonomuraea africana]|uniref:Hyaluronoglucosaminidase n=1 Tax=Nonomuraea africana TaxID=46171 RepID=A0ABR9KM06_9ACTN|nr:beta-N-acetylglucosaminidase domain-containing protein [Nonomuraea africana]MBE1562841.1 hyaluronoglucosaminidase [Nonomuraea africana]